MTRAGFCRTTETRCGPKAAPLETTAAAVAPRSTLRRVGKLEDDMFGRDALQCEHGERSPVDPTTCAFAPDSGREERDEVAGLVAMPHRGEHGEAQGERARLLLRGG